VSLTQEATFYGLFNVAATAVLCSNARHTLAPGKAYYDLVTFPILPPRPSGDGSLRKLTRVPQGAGTAIFLNTSIWLLTDRNTMDTPYVWHDLYRAALLETDRVRLQQALHAAKSAIDDRLQELQADHGGTPEERQAISDALAALNVIRREIETDRPTI
jgi:hypothetical protein